MPEFRITEFRGKSIVFNSAKWDLSAKDEKALLEFRSTLAEVLHGFPKALIEVNGTSDPRPYRVKGQVRDNIDLSAMRAATVAKLLAATDETSGEVITNDILVVGLGETGEVITDGVDLQIAYAKYRTVTLKLRIPLEGL